MNSKNPKRCSRDAISSRRGVAVTEFLIVFPTFLIFSMFVIEVSLMWSDRHVLRLAAFEAARALVTEAQVNETYQSVCWPENPNSNEERSRREHLMSVAKTAAANKIAMIAPTVTFFSAQVPGLAGAANAVDSALGGSQTVGGRYLAALKKFVLAWPMAWAMTTPTCHESNGMVTVHLRYYRAPRMPYVGSLLWAIKASQSINDATGGIIELGFDNIDHYGLSLDLSPGAAVAAITAARQELQDTVHIMQDMDWEHITAANSPINGLVSASLLDPIFSSNGALDRYTDQALGMIGAARAIVRQASPIATAVVYAMPDNLRLIPMDVEVSLSAGIPSNGDPNRPWNGRAFLVSPLTEGGEAWGKWTQNMQTIEGG